MLVRSKRLVKLELGKAEATWREGGGVDAITVTSCRREYRVSRNCRLDAASREERVANSLS